jgi:hypothetical protein
MTVRLSWVKEAIAVLKTADFRMAGLKVDGALLGRNFQQRGKLVARGRMLAT